MTELRLENLHLTPLKVCLPWVSKVGIWDVPGILQGRPGPVGGLQEVLAKKKFVLILRPLVSVRKVFPPFTISIHNVNQDTFDHDKGQKSAISGRRLHWRLSTGFFAFSPAFLVQFSKTSPLKSGESSEKSSGENRVKSCHACGCHGFFGPELSCEDLRVVLCCFS